ncbi:MAG: PSD1 and planctomycete cytochrome C domain-containing protein [Akkermansiaceae bacterium]|nr:PSD1 and planctomycete cytochrome C domain-containing protein [Akkermansiaceae bacterium]
MLRYFFIFIHVATAAGEPIGFNSHIRPLLSDHCFVCHGFDPNSREANLRLDTPEGAFADRKSGSAILPGDPEKSLIWKRIISDDPDDMMPPPDHLLKLDAEEKKLIYRWIKEGAKYENHWTFIAVKKSQVQDLSMHPIDSLVKQKLKKLKMDLSPRASKATLIRRLSFDLRGLPPTPEEVSAFLKDEGPSAWERLVNQFLADKALGERFAWPWLDAARYADSNGFQGDRERTMWPWRDWVIDAINRNLPYDDFTIWQIAGDLLPEATLEQKLATGFLRNHAINGEGGSIPEENRVNYVFDMTETVGTVWMGLTFNCCRCHDHKYDPLSQKDYYSLTAFFNQTPVNGSGGDPQTKPVLEVPTQQQIDKEDEIRGKLAEIRGQQKAVAAKFAPQQKAWEENQRQQNSQWKSLRASSITASDQGLKFEHLPDQSILSSGSNPNKATFQFTAPLPIGEISALRLDALRHPSMTKGGIARSDSGNFVLTRFETHLIRKGKQAQPLDLERPIATFEQSSYKIATALENGNTHGWAIFNGTSIDRDHAAIFHLGKPLTAQEGDQIKIVLRHNSHHAQHYIGRFKISVTDAATPSLEEDDQNVAQLLAIAPDQRNPDHRKRLDAAFLASRGEYQKISADISALEAQISTVRKGAPQVMVMEDRKDRRKTHILAVGSYQAQGKEVEAATPGLLPPLPEKENYNRLDLARWLVSPDHPLTSRVTVNRIWQELFGIGLIKSPEDLGVQSEIPIYPELLDWLSADFIESDWDFKKLIKTIVTSEVYQQSSKVDSLALERDPENRLLARAPRYRLPSWMIRDQALALSGRLIRQLGGTPVKPWQPQGLWAEVTFGKKKYTPDTGDNLRRRTLYTFWRRISAPPMIFDNAKREGCEVGTYRTNSPLHALATLNGPLYLEAARGIAYRAHKTSPKAILKTAFKLITARNPNEEELTIIKRMHEASRIHYEQNPAEVTALLSAGELAITDQIKPLEQASLTSTILSLLNTDEALTKE